MVVCASHIVCDLTTMGILLTEVLSLYNEQPLAPIIRTYEDTCAQRSAPDTDDLIYWQKTMVHPARGIRKRKAFCGTSRVIDIGKDLSNLIFAYLSTRSYTAHQVALAAVGLVSRIEASECCITLGGPYISRSPEDMSTVGLFLEALPIRVPHISTSHDDTLDSLVDYIHSCSQQALAHAIPLSDIACHLGDKTIPPDHPFFDTMVTFHDDRISILPRLPGASRQVVWSEGAKFQLMCEFTAVSSDCVLLRLEYDDDIYSQGEIIVLESMILAALDLICSNATYAGAQTILSSLKRGEAERRPPQTVAFGAFM